MGMRLSRKLEELSARREQEPAIPKKKESFHIVNDGDNLDRPKRRLVRDAEADSEVRNTEKRKQKEITRTAAKQVTADQTPQQRIADEQSIQTALENVEGSKLQGNRLKKEAVEKRKIAAHNRQDLDSQVVDDRERRMQPVKEFDEEQARQEAQTLTEQKAREEALEKAKKEDQQKIDDLHAFFRDGDYTKFSEPDSVVSTGEHMSETETESEDEGIAVEGDEELESAPKNIGSAKATQIFEGAKRPETRVRARKTGVKESKKSVESGKNLQELRRTEQEELLQEIERVKGEIRDIDLDLEVYDKRLFEYREKNDEPSIKTIENFIATAKKYRRNLESDFASLNLRLRGKKWQ